MSPDTFFEVSWEICNKVGGIHTVLSSKADSMKKKYEKYFVIGPYFKDKIAGTFEEFEQVPEEFKQVVDEFNNEGIKVHVGTWLIGAEPTAILIEHLPMMHLADDVKRKLWDRYKIDSLNAPYDYSEPVLWSWLAGRLIQRYKDIHSENNIVAQFHEWLGGAGMLYLRMNDVKVGTVFTTHASTLGRSLASANVNIYCAGEDKCDLAALNVDEEAAKRGVLAKHLMEKACAHETHAFTTVSEVTGFESELILKKKPDVILPNGLHMDKFPTYEENSIQHRENRERIRNFCRKFFFPYYTFDLEHTLFYFIAGRYEFHDKGIDIYIHALSRLNHELMKQNSERNIVAFIFVPAATKDLNHDVLDNITLFNDVEELFDNNFDLIMDRVIDASIQKRDATISEIFPPSLNKDLRRRIARFHKSGNPPLCTHEIAYQGDPIYETLKGNGLNNAENTKVKVIYYPIFLTGADSLLDLNYYEVIQGSHLGVFPSYYEPWGYTPLETGALSVAAVTTDLAGFGLYFREKVAKVNPGLYVINRRNKTDEDAINQLTKVFMDFSSLSQKDRAQSKIHIKTLVAEADWEVFSKHYFEAHDLALSKVK